jgi:hypothetical protein
MSEYLIVFNGEWTPDHTVEELQAKSRAVRALLCAGRAAYATARSMPSIICVSERDS